MKFENILNYLNSINIDFSTIAAIIAAISAYGSYLLSKRIFDEIKSDEVIISGELHHIGLGEREHDRSVLRCTLFNKSKRKAYINSVKAYEKNGNEIDITWSNSCDKLGNIQNPTGLLGIIDSTNLIIRRNDGEVFFYTKVIIKNSFSSDSIEVDFEPFLD